MSPAPRLALLVLLPAPALAQLVVDASLPREIPPTEASPPPREGLDVRELPVESRRDVADVVGRNLPGASLDPHGLLLRGGGAGDTALVVDGIRVRHLAVPLALVDRLQVETAGYGASWADVAGGVVSLDTGSRLADRWHASGEVFHDFRDRVSNDAGPSAAGPLGRTVSAALAVEGELASAPGEEHAFLSTAPPTESRWLRGGLKLTWAPSTARQHHRLDSLTVVDGDRLDNGAGALVEREAQPTYSTRTLFTLLRWEGWFSEALTARAALALTSGTVRESPMSCRWAPQLCEEVSPVLDRANGLTRQNWGRRESERDTGLDLTAGLDARLFNGPRVQERALVTSRLDLRGFTSDASVPGGVVLFVADGRPLERREIASNHVTSSSLRSVHALESVTTVGRRLSLVPGLALVTSHAQNSGGVAFGDALLTPHLGARWDVFGEGGWLAVRASTHRRVDADLERFARATLPAPLVSACSWNEPAMMYTPCRMEGGVSPLAPPEHMARTWEHSAGVELRDEHLRLDVDALYRRTSDFVDSRYRGVTTSITGHRARADLFLAYTLSRHDARVDLADDRRHAIEALARYDLFGYGAVSAIFTWESGRPQEPPPTGHVRGIYEDYPASRVVDPLSGSSGFGGRLHPSKRFNLQARLGGERLLKDRVALWADVFNVFDWGRGAGPEWVFGHYQWQEGRSVRLGLECRY